MFSTTVGLALLSLLAVAMLPVPRVRRLLLTGTARMVQAAVLAFLGACGTFFVQPQAAPGWLTNAASPLLEGTLGTSLDASSGVPWLVLAVLTVAVSLPVLILVELAISLSGLTALVQALRREVRQTGAWVDSRLIALGVRGPAYQPLPDEAAAAAEALRSAGQEDKQSPSAPAPLVLDLLK